MAKNLQLTQATCLEHLPPEILGKVVDFCADDAAAGRATLLNLSVMNKYLRDVTTPKLFQRIRFRDSPESPGDEILHSIRRFMAAPWLRKHARTLSLHLNRRNCGGTDHATLTEPYHPLVLPELVDALIRMPEILEIFIRTDGRQGRTCMGGLQAAVRWCAAGKEFNVTSLTLSPDSPTDLGCDCENPNEQEEVHYFEALPQLKTLCFEGTSRCSVYGVLTAGRPGHPTITPNLTQLRIYQTCSDPRKPFDVDGWRDSEIKCLYLNKVTPELEYLSVLGELRNIPVTKLLKDLAEIPKLKYVDITDEQIRGSFNPSWKDFEKAYAALPRTRPMQGSRSQAYIAFKANNHPKNGYRPNLAMETFRQCPQLRRICFVRSMVGEVYLRGYYDAVADSMGYISDEIMDADLIHIPDRWLHGVPQTGLMPFPGFTPWEGF